MLRRILSQSLTQSRLYFKTDLSAKNTGFLTIAKKCSTAPSEAPASVAAAQKNAANEQQDRSPTSGGEKMSYIRSSSPETVYEFFKRLVDSQRNIQSRGVLGKALKGVVASNSDMEFVDYYFDHWWKQFCAAADDETMKTFLGPMVADLGKINARTHGELTKSFNLKAFQYLESKFLANEFTDRDLFLFFSGLGKLASTQAVISEKLISDELLSKVISVLKTPKESGPGEPQFRHASYFSAILESLPTLNVVLNKADLGFTATYFKSKFDDEKFTVIDKNLPLKELIFDYHAKIETLSQFGDTFLAWQINADDLCNNSWKSWFTASKKLLSVNEDVEYPPPPPRRSNRDAATENKGVGRRTLASDVMNLCASLANVATRFDKIDVLLDMNEIWFKVLRKNLHICSADAVFPLSKAVRHAQLHIDAKRALSSSTPAESRLIDEPLAQIIAKRVEANKSFVRRKLTSGGGQQRNEREGDFYRQQGQESFRRDDRGFRGGDVNRDFADRRSPRSDSYYEEDYRSY